MKIEQDFVLAGIKWMSCRIEGGEGQAGGHSLGAAVRTTTLLRPTKSILMRAHVATGREWLPTQLTEVQILGGLIQAIVRPRTGG